MNSYLQRFFVALVLIASNLLTLLCFIGLAFPAFLDYYNIPYKVVEVNPISKKELKWSDYKKVPVLMVDGERMVNSTGI